MRQPRAPEFNRRRLTTTTHGFEDSTNDTYRGNVVSRESNPLRFFPTPPPPCWRRLRLPSNPQALHPSHVATETVLLQQRIKTSEEVESLMRHHYLAMWPGGTWKSSSSASSGGSCLKAPLRARIARMPSLMIGVKPWQLLNLVDMLKNDEHDSTCSGKPGLLGRFPAASAFAHASCTGLLFFFLSVLLFCRRLPALQAFAPPGTSPGLVPFLTA